MSGYFKDKVVVVTGGTDGIGKALVDALLREGARVATCGRNHDKLYRLQSEYPSAFLHTMLADVSSENDCRRLMESTVRVFGGIDILVNNAGMSMRALLRETSLDTIRTIMEINFWGSVYCTRHALDAIIARKGTIVGVSSIAGYRGLPTSLAYGPTKAALINLAQTLYLDLQPQGLGVSVVNPGFVETPLTSQNEFTMPALLTPAEAAQEIVAGWEAGRFEIHFPKRFTLWLKLLSHLGDALYFKAVRRATGL